MKVIRRNYEHWNIIFFLIFSLVYLQAIYSLSTGVSLFRINSLSSLVKNHYFILLLNFLAIYMVLTLKRYSDKILLVCLVVMAGKNFILLSASFNKLILGLSFAYLIFAFYFFVMWELEIARAANNPNFSKYDLEITPRFPLVASLEKSDGTFICDARITNIDEESCFIFLINEEVEKTLKEFNFKNTYRLTAELEGISFAQSARLVSSYSQGIGLIWTRSKSDNRTHNWSDLYKVCLERGLFA